MLAGIGGALRPESPLPATEQFLTLSAADSANNTAVLRIWSDIRTLASFSQRSDDCGGNDRYAVVAIEVVGAQAIIDLNKFARLDMGLGQYGFDQIFLDSGVELLGAHAGQFTA